MRPSMPISITYRHVIDTVRYHVETASVLCRYLIDAISTLSILCRYYIDTISTIYGCCVDIVSMLSQWRADLNPYRSPPDAKSQTQHAQSLSNISSWKMQEATVCKRAPSKHIRARTHARAKHARTTHTHALQYTLCCVRTTRQPRRLRKRCCKLSVYTCIL